MRALTLGLVIVGISYQAHGSPLVAAYSSVVDDVAEEVTFFAEFDGIPDFSGSGFTPNELQYNIDPTSSLAGSGVDVGAGPLPPEAVTFFCSGLPTTCPVWTLNFQGAASGSVPFEVNGTVFQFTASFAQLNTTTGDFTYMIEDASFNSVRHQLFGTSGVSHVVPEASSALLLGLGLIGLSFSKRSIFRA